VANGRVGVLLLQLGTPEAPTTAAVRRYLREFLSDRRVVDLPRALWWPILNLCVLTTRPRRSAELYRKVWTADGSPLARTSQAQAAALQYDGTESTLPIRSAVAMRYGSPSIADALAALDDAGVDRLLAFPMYPQYAGATTGSSLERLHLEIARRRVVPPLRVVPPYFDDPHYVDAVACVARRSLATCPWTPDHYVISFHGLPKRYADAGDPYPAHCRRTAELLVERMQWPASQVTVTFQSRFGREAWLQPYTDQTLLRLGCRRERVAVICPGFVADCLETLEEIDITNRERFMEAGGRKFHYIPCVNDDPCWLAAMRRIAGRELAGWT
jgi:ferrochelatase